MSRLLSEEKAFFRSASGARTVSAAFSNCAWAYSLLLPLHIVRSCSIRLFCCCWFLFLFFFCRAFEEFSAGIFFFLASDRIRIEAYFSISSPCSFGRRVNRYRFLRSKSIWSYTDRFFCIQERAENAERERDPKGRSVTFRRWRSETWILFSWQKEGIVATVARREQWRWRCCQVAMTKTWIWAEELLLPTAAIFSSRCLCLLTELPRNPASQWRLLQQPNLGQQNLSTSCRKISRTWRMHMCNWR